MKEEKDFHEQIKQLNNKLTKEYTEHKVFYELDMYIEYYDLLSFSISSWLTSGVNDIMNFDNQIITSTQNTLESIKMLLEHGKINDVFSLTRRYHDSVIINIYALSYLEENYSLNNTIVDKINNWVNNKEKLPQYKEMNNYIRNHSSRLKHINRLLFKSQYYKNMRQRFNDHTHYNFFTYMLYNDNKMIDPLNNRIKFLDQLSIDIRNIFIKHFVWLFSLKDNYMMASDYIDYLDMGMTSPENSQYLVSSFVQEAFDKIIMKYRPDLAVELKKSTSMELK